MIIEVLWDRCSGVEESIPTTIENPTDKMDGVAHTPSFFWKTITETLSKELVKYVDFFIEGHPLDSKVLRDCHNFERGVILGPRIFTFQGE